MVRRSFVRAYESSRAGRPYHNPRIESADKLCAKVSDAQSRRQSRFRRLAGLSLYCNRTATGLVQAGTQQTNAFLEIAENPINRPIHRTHQDAL